MLDSTKKIKKARKPITSIGDTNKLSVCQNVPLRCHRSTTKNNPEVGKVV